MNNPMDKTTEQGITVELESAVGPRVVFPEGVSSWDIESPLPHGWALSDTPAVQTQDGRWSAPLVRTLTWQVAQELERLDAGGPDGIDARPGDSGMAEAVELYDTQERVELNGSRVLELLRALPDGVGFEATWQALAELCS